MNNQATMDWTPDEPEQDTPDTMAGEHTTQAGPVGAPVEESQPEPEKTENGTELVAIEKYDMVALFSDGGADPLLDEIEKQAESIVTDVTTEKGRKEIASMAYRIARSKTTLDNEGKRLKDEAQKTVNTVDAERKKIRDRLDALKEKVRAPLTEFEEREKERVETHEHILAQIGNATQFDHVDPEASTIASRIDDVAKAYNRDWQEFSETAKVAYEQATERLGQMFADRNKRDEEAAELERLRKEKEERERQEREERLQKEAAEKARKEAEEKAAREKAEAEARAKAEQDRLQKEKEEAERKAREEKERAEREANEAAERAEKEKQEAVEAERKRIADEARKQNEEREKREADIKHKEKIHADAIKSFMDYSWCDESIAKEILEAIAAGKVPHVKIEY